jgi:hypothetical protein
MSYIHKTKEFVTFNCHTHTHSYFWVLTKMILIKAVCPLSIYQHTKCHSPTLTGSSFASKPEVWTSVILEWLKLEIKKYGADVTFNGMFSPLNFMKIYQLVQKFISWGHSDWQTDRQIARWSNKHRFTFFKESRLKSVLCYFNVFREVRSHLKRKRVWRHETHYTISSLLLVTLPCIKLFLQHDVHKTLSSLHPQHNKPLNCIRLNFQNPCFFNYMREVMQIV